MRAFSGRRSASRRGVAIAAVVFITVLALGAQSISAKPDHGSGNGNGNAYGHAKGQVAPPPAPPASPPPATPQPAPAPPGPAAPASTATTVPNFVVTVTPHETTLFVGETVTVTAHLANGVGSALSGEPLHFTLTGVSEDRFNGQTDSTGNVAHSYSSALPGTDTLRACLHRDEAKTTPDTDPDSNEAQKYCDSATIHWITAPTDLAVALSQSAAAIGVGHTDTLTAVVTNKGLGTATGVRLSYSPPAGLTVASASAGQGSCTTAVVCALGSLAPGASVTVTIVVDGASAGTFTSTVTVSADQDDPVATNNSASVVTSVEGPDVSVTLKASPTRAAVGDPITLTAVVQNGGLGAATGVTFTYAVPTGLDVQSVSTTQGTCSGTQSVACDIGMVDGGASVTVTIVVKATKEGTYLSTVQVTGDQTNTGNNTSTVTTSAGGSPPPLPLVPPPPPPSAPFKPPSGPVQGVTVDVEPVEGLVLVQLRGKKAFVPIRKLRRIPVGSIVDVSHGVVKLTSAANRAGKLQAGVFYDGVFKVRQKKQALVQLELAAGDFSACGAQTEGRTLQVAKKKPIQSLWGNGKGKFRTSGQYSSATVIGTKWLVIDYCDGTMTIVKRGVVKVFDFVTKKIVTVQAGESYFAEAPK